MVCVSLLKAPLETLAKMMQCLQFLVEPAKNITVKLKVWRSISHTYINTHTHIHTQTHKHTHTHTHTQTHTHTHKHTHTHTYTEETFCVIECVLVLERERECVHMCV